MENWDINWDSAHILCIHYIFLAGTIICSIMHTIILTGRNCHLPHYAYIQLYIYTYWQELSSAPLRTHTVIHLYLLAGTVICPITQTYVQLYVLLISRNCHPAITCTHGYTSCHLPHYTYLQLYYLTGTVVYPNTVILVGRNCHDTYIHLYLTEIITWL